MRRMIVTQRIGCGRTGFGDGSDDQNLGGLYLNLDHVSAIFFDRNKSNGCHVQMSCGSVYHVAHSTSEILDMVVEENIKTLKDEIKAQCDPRGLNPELTSVSHLLGVM